MITKTQSLFFLISFITSSLFAQSQIDKINLTKGQIIKVKSIDTSNLAQKRGEESMDMKTFSNSYTEYQILDVENDHYRVSQTLKQIQIDFDGYGQKMSYNSSDTTKKQEGMMADQLKDKINKADTILLGFDGKMIEQNNEKKKDKKGGGMMRMMNQGMSGIDNAFLIIPTDVKEETGWKKDNTKDDLKSQTIYFVEKINGNMIELSFKKKTKGTVTTKGGPAGEMKINIDNLSSGKITVDRTSSRVLTYTETTQSNSKFNAMGQDMSTEGTIINHTIFE